jgi:ActR/RegA family two-component response regulator
MAFLAMAFVVVGLVGLFASYAAPLPLQRAMARDATLDEALATGGQKAALEPLRERLDDSAPLVIDGTGPIAGRVAAARAAMHASLMHEADAVGDRLRLELLVVTVVAAAFGAVVIGAVARAP